MPPLLENLPDSLYAFIQATIGLALILIVFLEMGLKHVRCRSCGTRNKVDALTCVRCGEGLPYSLSLISILLVLYAGLAGLGIFMVGILKYQLAQDESVANILRMTNPLFLLVAAMFILKLVANHRKKIQQDSLIVRQDFYGGFCASCGAEILGGVHACPYCG